VNIHLWKFLPEVKPIGGINQTGIGDFSQNSTLVPGLEGFVLHLKNQNLLAC
jgi:hypothetical protein